LENNLKFHRIATNNNLENIEGIAFREENEIKLNPNRTLIQDLASLPLPAWHLYESMALEKKERPWSCQWSAREDVHLIAFFVIEYVEKP